MVLYKAQTYPLPKCFRRSCCLMTLMFICSECILPNFWVGKENMHNISLVFGQIAPSWGCRFVKHDYRFPVSLFVAALPVTGRGSIPAPRISGNHREQAKRCDRSSWAQADTEKQQPDDTWRLDNWRRELLYGISKQTLEGWDWS